jgi:hypothetical protein
MTVNRAALLAILGAAALGSACTTETMSTAPTAVSEDGGLAAARRGPGVRLWVGTMTVKGDVIKVDPVAGTMLIADYGTPSPGGVPVPTLVVVLGSTTVTIDGQPGKLGQIQPGYLTTIEGTWRPRWFEASTVTATKG